MYVPTLILVRACTCSTSPKSSLIPLGCMYGPGCSGQPAAGTGQGRAGQGGDRHRPASISASESVTTSCVRATLGPTRYNALSSRDSRELCDDSTGTHLDQLCCVRGCVHFICVSPPRNGDESRNGNRNRNGRSGHVCTVGPCQGASAATESLTSL